MAQLHLINILEQHNTNLKLYDDIMKWIRLHHEYQCVDWSLMCNNTRLQLLNQVVVSMGLRDLKPTIVKVPLISRGGYASVPVYKFTKMILSVLHDKSLMIKENFLDHYDIWTGMCTIKVTKFGDVHTGEEWAPAVQKFCKNNKQYFPLPLVCFYNKSHSDLWGGLSSSPMIFCPLIFKQHVRNKVDFWNILQYVPNLSYGRGKHDTSTTQQRLQDEHLCLY